MNSTDENLPNLRAFLDRIGFRGVARPDLATLCELQRSHVYTVSFENLDVQLRRPVGLDLERCFDKIVNKRRGGWCYELNGVFGWALQEIGFNVMRVSAGVMRERAGDEQLGNHLCLLVQLEQDYLVDVGFGGSLSRPLPLREATHDQSPYRITLSKTNDNYWRFSELARGAPFSFDFRSEVADEALLAEKCAMLQQSAESTFVQNLVVQKRTDDMHIALRGRVLTTLRATGEERTILASAEELVSVLQNSFELNVPEVAAVWPAICARHDDVLTNQVKVSA